MPNRIIKESIWTSQNFNELSDLAERHFYRILLLPDDFGCCELTPLVVKGKCYPLKLKITPEQINSWQNELEEKEILLRWQQGKREFGIFINFAKHQRIRSVHQRKTPEPPQEILVRIHGLEDNYDDCCQLTANDRLNPNPNPNPNPNKENIKKKKPFNLEGKIKLLDFVFLTQTDTDKLIEDYGKSVYNDYITRLDTYLTDHPEKQIDGKDRYYDHNKTIRNWIRLANVPLRQKPNTQGYIPI